MDSFSFQPSTIASELPTGVGSRGEEPFLTASAELVQRLLAIEQHIRTSLEQQLLCNDALKTFISRAHSLSSSRLSRRAATEGPSFHSPAPPTDTAQLISQLATASNRLTMHQETMSRAIGSIEMRLQSIETKSTSTELTVTSLEATVDSLRNSVQTLMGKLSELSAGRSEFDNSNSNGPPALVVSPQDSETPPIPPAFFLDPFHGLFGSAIGITASHPQASSCEVLLGPMIWGEDVDDDLQDARDLLNFVLPHTACPAFRARRHSDNYVACTFDSPTVAQGIISAWNEAARLRRALD
ncbi:hypothetical protein C8R46DRAFT_1220441 [Mycena filopes]|nr:hypothetical protein C8R46DRAFT_1220441 [Mycena filopes]